MKKIRLQLKRETIRQLGGIAAAHGGQIAQSDGLCVTVQFTNCPTYKEITCASNLPSCLTQPEYCA